MTKAISNDLQEHPLRQVLQRTGESLFVPGNKVTLLLDGPAVFDAWLDEIAKAKKYILLENYIIRDDQIGRVFLRALCDKAQQGVPVYVLYDWLGSFGTSPSFWKPFIKAGGHLRVFNPWRWENPLGIIQRDHSKLLCVDGQVGFVGGVCIGDVWAGVPERNQLPWRDTAVGMRGPCVQDLCEAFDTAWSASGSPLPRRLFLPHPLQMPQADQGAWVQVIRGAPWRSLVYRQIQSLFSGAASRIWITDAYFVLPPYLYESLVAAAKNGVDVRVLGPRHSDIGYVTWLSRSGYGGLLEAGVRIFEWEGSMLHAKTMVVDGRWSKVGSSNMNSASLLTSWEKDVLIDDPAFAKIMEHTFLEDLDNATELVLAPRKKLSGYIQRMQLETSDEDKTDTSMRKKILQFGQYGSEKRAVLARLGAGLLALALRRPFQRNGWTTSAVLGVFLLLAGIVVWFGSHYVGIGLAIISTWWGISFLLQSIDRWRQKKSDSVAHIDDGPAPEAFRVKKPLHAETKTDKEKPKK